MSEDKQTLEEARKKMKGIYQDAWLFLVAMSIDAMLIILIALLRIVPDYMAEGQVLKAMLHVIIASLMPGALALLGFMFGYMYGKYKALVDMLSRYVVKEVEE